MRGNQCLLRDDEVGFLAMDINVLRAWIELKASFVLGSEDDTSSMLNLVKRRLT